MWSLRKLTIEDWQSTTLSLLTSEEIYRNVGETLAGLRAPLRRRRPKTFACKSAYSITYTPHTRASSGVCVYYV